jgi:ABC-type sugar transport system ATPase subunit
MTGMNPMTGPRPGNLGPSSRQPSAGEQGHSAAAAPAIELVDIVKTYPGVRALDAVSFDAAHGEIHAVVGENGAGKSTLMKIIMGVTAPDAGQIRIEGQEVRPRSPREARRRYGIKMIPQKLELCERLVVGRNVLLGLEGPLVRRTKLSSEERARIDRAFHLIAARVNPRRSSHDLSVPEARLVQIAHTLIAPGNVVLCDEPTAVLSEVDAEALLEWLVKMRTEASMTIVYVSHRLSEVLRIADRITVLRDGHRVGTFARDQVDRQQVIELMTKSGSGRPKVRPPLGLGKRRKASKLEVRGLSLGGSFQQVSLTVESGQIVGIAGVQGAGYGPLLAAIAGAREYESGSIILDDRPVPPGSSAKVCRLGIGLVPGDRRHGIAPTLRVRENIALPVTGSLSRFGVRMRRAERESALTYTEAFDIRGAGSETVARNLSGGNQQKLALARVLQGAPRFLLLEEPTQGIDVRAKAEIRDLVVRLARQEGLGALLASSEFEDLLGFADVIHVMRLGRIVATLDGEEARYGDILHRALP